MRGRLSSAVLCLFLVRAAWGGPGTVPSGFHDSLVVGGLTVPTALALMPDGRALFTEQFDGRIRLIVNGAIASVDPVCTVPGVRNNPGSEQGLLGIVVDPQFPARPYVYVHYDDATTPTIHIARFNVTGDLSFTGDGHLAIDPASRHDLITDIPDNASNHNGGTVHFGPDGMLYVSLGEDANACAAQDVASLRGKLLRLDVAGVADGPGAAPPRATITPSDNPFVGNASLDARLVWALGLRNPFRFWIDSNGDAFVGDVGQSAWEEIDRVPAEGLNFGWPLFEGTTASATCPGVNNPPVTPPVHVYGHSSGSYAVIGGPVYRAGACAGAVSFPVAYHGDYFFSDYYKGFLRRLQGSGNNWTAAPPVPGQPNFTDWGTGFDGVSDYALGCDGAIWYCRQSGEIRRIVYDGTTTVPPAIPPVAFAAPWPSPARDDVHLDYELPSAARVSLELFDARGRRVRRVVALEDQVSGPHQAVWDGRDERGQRAAAGVYFAELTVNGAGIVRRLVLAP